MKASRIIRAKLLKAGDLTADINLTIEDVQVETLGVKRLLVVGFAEIPERFGLNRVNGERLQELFGDETGDWIGKRITLFKTQVKFKGDLVPGIRIRDWRDQP